VLRQRRPGYTRLIELERQLRCRRCGARGRGVARGGISASR